MDPVNQSIELATPVLLLCWKIIPCSPCPVLLSENISANMPTVAMYCDDDDNAGQYHLRGLWEFELRHCPKLSPLAPVSLLVSPLLDYVTVSLLVFRNVSGMWIFIPVRLTLGDLGAPGWGEPWFRLRVVLLLSHVCLYGDVFLALRCLWFFFVTPYWWLCDHA